MPFGFKRKRSRAGNSGEERLGQVRGRTGFGPGAPPGNCVCPRCGLIAPHEPGAPCYLRKCPQCGSFMARQFPKTD